MNYQHRARAKNQGIMILLVIMIISAVVVSPVLAAAPGNDDVASATVVGSLPFTDAVDTTDATVEGSEPSYYCGYQVGATVWYTYTPTTTGDVFINTEGSDYDPVVFVYLDGGATPVDCDPDAQLLLTLIAGETYLIGVGGNSAATGNLVVNIVEPGPFTVCNSVDIAEVECDALVALYTAAGGASWINNDGWMATDIVCTWYGISCQGGSVRFIVLALNNLIGDLSTVDFTDLTNLVTLNLHGNQLSGDFSTIIGYLPLGIQVLYLSSNDLIGSIPPGISSLTALSTLSIGDNQLAGDLAAAMANLPVGMYVLGLDNNDFYGTVPPEGLTLTNLYSFSAQGNLLSGDLSIAIGNLPTGLNEISLGWNDFTGTIPPAISSFTNLAILGVAGNELGGDIAAAVNDLPASLTRLYMAENNFTGTIPSSISGLTNLQRLDLGGNQLTDDLSTLIGMLPTTLERLFLDNLNLTGTIPTSISDLSKLNYFYLNNNPGLSGTIPVSISGLPMVYFDFQHTFLCEPVDGAYDSWVLTIAYYYPGYCKLAASSLFEDDFETGDFSLWTRFNDGNGYLYPCTDGAINGTWGACVDRGTDKRKQLIDETPINQTAYDVRFNIDMNSLSMAEGTRFRFVQVKMGAERPFFIVVKYQGGQYLIQLNTLRDDLTKAKTGWYFLSDEPHTLEISWSAAPYAVSNDGWANLYLDDVLQEGLLGLDNDSIYVDTFKIGFTSRLDGKPISGIFYLDDIATTNDGYIGLP